MAVAILQRKNKHGQCEFLLASRPQGKGWAGWWEFPGGKIEVGETPAHALKRELQEELGITPTLTQQWLTRRFDYPQTHDAQAKTVMLHFYFVNAWQGAIEPKEGQQLSWQNPQKITVSPVLPANAPIMQALALPPVYAISNVAEMGESAWLSALESKLKNSLSLIQLREKQLTDAAWMRLAGQVLTMAKAHDAKVLIHGDVRLAQKIGADGVHLNSLQLMQLTEKPAGLMIAASCHNALELARAQQLGLDLVVLSPVKPTKSHENAATLGWDTFKSLLAHAMLPVYALGGLQMRDLDQALSCGARGIAMQRAIWA
ncbi:MAG: Nudix family hydrolase [Bdellovibrio sp.]|nr:Nudix family hydrolase [Methylotenera sp.]